MHDQIETMRCLLLRQRPGGVAAAVERISAADIPGEGDVLVRVLYSALNYKDALAVTGRGKIIRGEYPFVPGIDLAGVVEESDDAEIEVGAAVIGTGWGLGEDRWGGYCEYQRMGSEQLVELPEGMDLRTAISAGTAGLTAMLSVMAIEEGGAVPGSGEIVVTGASGGVGSFSILFLSQLGYTVVASTGKPSAEEYLRRLGAARVVDRRVLSAGPSRPLDSGRWAGAVDSVGGSTLSAILSQTHRHGVVASCGLVAGAELVTTIYPFILRGIRLVGIDSNTCPMDVRRTAWTRIGQSLTSSAARMMSREIDLTEIVAASERILAGDVRGRLVVVVAGSS